MHLSTIHSLSNSTTILGILVREYFFLLCLLVTISHMLYFADCFLVKNWFLETQYSGCNPILESTSAKLSTDNKTTSNVIIFSKKVTFDSQLSVPEVSLLCDSSFIFSTASKSWFYHSYQNHMQVDTRNTFQTPVKNVTDGFICKRTRIDWCKITI